jgi:S-adenosylmethionine hydrolase
MAIVTLTTDYGTRDPYLAALKGSLLKNLPGVQIVDISNHITAFDTMEAAFVLEEAFPHFPDETIHLIGVDPLGSNSSHSFAVKMDGHFFLGPQNDILPLLCSGKTHQAVLISPEVVPYPTEGKAFQALHRLTKAIPILAETRELTALGEEIEIKPKAWGVPAYVGNTLRGEILHIDRFGNGITNIKKEYFLEVKGNRAFEIFLRKTNTKRIVSSYGDEPIGDFFALFSNSGRLEIGIRNENGAKMLGLSRHDHISIEFIG